MPYNWQFNNWPSFEYNAEAFEGMACQFSEAVGQSMGVLQTLPGGQQDESLITLLVKEAIKTSAIEGEMISRADLILSIRKNLGFPTPSVIVKDKRSEGVAELIVQSRVGFADALSELMPFDWHKLLMRGNYSVEVGQWRTHPEPMQVVSGAMGRERVHFEASSSERVSAEIQAFIAWFNETGPAGTRPILNPIARSAIAHLYFESIHPFEDGNGRIGRIIAEKALSQNVGRAVLLSLSASIAANKNAYYATLQNAQHTNQITEWIQYLGDIILAAQRAFVQTMVYSIKKARFFETHRANLNDRQQRVISRMLAEEEGDFVGGMNARKYQAIAKTSKATATRDLRDSVERRILSVVGGGRSTNYQVNLGE